MIGKFSDHIVYVDESGDHSLKNINPEFPIFVLAFCIFRKEEFATKVAPIVKQFKFRWFGHDMEILHEKEIIRKENAFLFLQNSILAQRFMRELSEIISELPMRVIASVIDKRKLGTRYKNPMNPYDIALLFCMERCAAFLADLNDLSNTTFIVAESRSPRSSGIGREDQDLYECFKLIKSGRHALQGASNQMENFELLMASKKSNSIGLQLADLIARPIGLSVLRPDQSNRAFEIIKTKIWKSNYDMSGLKIFP